MEGELKSTIQEKVQDGATDAPPPFTRRDVHVPGIPGKVLAVIGMRRSGKTTFLWQCLADRLKEGVPREALLYFNFEDDRLAGMKATDLQWITEAYFRLYPHLRLNQKVHFYFDEIQLVPGWESFIRRLIDSEKAAVMLTGSSARLLSREIATSMRGRALEVLVHPFSFRELLRHRGMEPDKPLERHTKAARSALLREFDLYLQEGGFPEAQLSSRRDHDALLRSYVDVAILRDVVERHSVTNPTALRWMVRQLLGNAGAPFSVQKFFDSLKSQGIAVSRDSLHAYLGHLEDAFLVRTVSLHSASERQRMVNPRKAYPVDPGLVQVFERSGRANTGHSLETAVLLELERRGARTGYCRTPGGFEVDFHAEFAGGSTWLIQVCASLAGADTLAREARALEDGAAAYPDAVPLLLSGDALRPAALPDGITWQPAATWLLGDSAA